MIINKYDIVQVITMDYTRSCKIYLFIYGLGSRRWKPVMLHKERQGFGNAKHWRLDHFEAGNESRFPCVFVAKMF